MRFVFFASLLFFIGSQVSGQSGVPPEEEVDNQIWVNYAITVPSKVNERLYYGGDVGVRGFVSRQDWNQYLIRPKVSWRFNQTYNVSFATAVFSTYNSYDANVIELRMHQDFNINWPDLGFMQFFYRLRVEQRWFKYDDADISNEFNWRIRYLAGIESQDFRLRRGGKPFYLQVMFEWFNTLERLEASEFYINNTRFHVAYGHRLSKRFRYEVHYINQRSTYLEEDGNRATQNIFRVRFFHRILRDKTKEEEIENDLKE